MRLQHFNVDVDAFLNTYLNQGVTLTGLSSHSRDIVVITSEQKDEQANEWDSLKHNAFANTVGLHLFVCYCGQGSSLHPGPQRWNHYVSPMHLSR